MGTLQAEWGRHLRAPRRGRLQMVRGGPKPAGCLLAAACFAVFYYIVGEPPDDGSRALVKEGARTAVDVAVRSGSPAVSGRRRAPSVASQTWSKVPEQIEAKRQVPRYNFHLKHVSNQFCGGHKYTKDGKCSKDYKHSLAMVSLPVMIVGLFTFIVGLFVFIGRNCCWCFCTNGCCGGKVPTKGFCCG